MAKQIKEILIDDIDQGEAHETVSFAVDGSTYEIDLHSEKADALRTLFNPYILKGRPVRAERRRRGGASTRTIDRQKSAEIRQWAKAHNIPVSERGRIAENIVKQYEAAH